MITRLRPRPRASGQPSPRSFDVSTGSHWQSNWLRARLRTLDVEEVATRRWITASSCCRPAHAPRLATVRWPRRCHGPTTSSTRSCSEPSPICRPSPDRSRSRMPPPSADSMRDGRPRCSINSLNVRSSCGCADRRFVLLETLRAYGAQQLLAEGRAEATGAPPRPSLRRVDRTSRAPTAGLRARHRRHRRRHAGAAGGLQLAAGPRRCRIGREVGRRPGRTTPCSGCAPKSSPGPNVSSPPTARTAVRWRRAVWAAASYAAWMAGDVSEAGVRAKRALRWANAPATSEPSSSW